MSDLMSPADAYNEISRLYHTGAIEHNKEWIPVYEARIAHDATASYQYALYILEGRFELGEPAIAESAVYSFLYARYVLYERFDGGEPAIATKAKESYWYATEVLFDRFNLAEDLIAESEFAPQYNKHFNII